MERINGGEEPFRITGEFGLTVEDVRLAKEETEEDVKKWQEIIDGEYTPDSLTEEQIRKLRETASESLARAQGQLAVLSADPEEILDKMRRIYDKAIELSGKVTARQLMEQLLESFGEDFLNLLDYYPLLKRVHWGEVLVQLSNAARLRKGMKEMGQILE